MVGEGDRVETDSLLAGCPPDHDSFGWFVDAPCGSRSDAGNYCAIEDGGST